MMIFQYDTNWFILS